MKKKSFVELTTPFEKNIEDIPWSEYPRPQFRRDSYLTLNGTWEYAIAKNKEIPSTFDQTILVPFPLGSKMSGTARLLKKGEYLFYHKCFSLPKDFQKDRVILHVDAIDQLSEFYLNGIRVGKSENGYLRQSLDITDVLSEKNELIICVQDDNSKDYPYGKQRRKRGGMWYTPISGIWKSVWLESLPKHPIPSFRYQWKEEMQEVEFLVQCDEEVELRIKTDEETISIHGKDKLVWKVKNAKTWSSETPYLYSITLRSSNDEVHSYIALRSVKCFDGKLYLNGKRLFLNGLLDQGYYSDGIYLPSSVEGYRQDILSIKEMGFNTLRKHIKIEPDIFYYLCDYYGVYVLQDFVNNGSYHYLIDTVYPTILAKVLPDRHRYRNKARRNIFLDAMEKSVEQLRHFPSIVGWTIFNEGWGQTDSDECYDILHFLDDTRFIDTTSGWFHQKKSDVESEHVYFHPLHLKRKYPSRPYLLTEFGGYSWKVQDHSYNLKKNYGYKNFPSLEDYQKGLLALYERDVLANLKDLSGIIYTQLSDVEDETNGLWTYDRQVLKVDIHEMKKLNENILKEIKDDEN